MGQYLMRMFLSAAHILQRATTTGVLMSHTHSQSHRQYVAPAGNELLQKYWSVCVALLQLLSMFEIACVT